MVNIHDVAKYAGVSISTVSNALTNKRYVSENLKNKVLKAVEELDYVPDPIASTMKSGNSNTIGVITADICGLFYPYVLKGIYRTLVPKGFNITIFDIHSEKQKISKYDESVEFQSFQKLLTSRVDGIIFVSNMTDENKDYYKHLKEEVNKFKKTPLVSIERNLSQYGIDSVFYDNIALAEKATKHLITQGCKNIAHITGPRGQQIPEYRIAGYIEALSNHNISFDQCGKIVNGNYTHQSGYSAMKMIVESDFPVDGVYAANDQMAIGAIKFLKEQGYSIPKQIKIIGTDNIFVSSLLDPSLSTVEISKETLGVQAAEILLQRLSQVREEKDLGKAIQKKIDTKLVVRKSTDNDIPMLKESWIMD